jgi:hypothetical protein
VTKPTTVGQSLSIKSYAPAAISAQRAMHAMVLQLQ